MPAAGETGWSALSNFLIALGNGAAIAEELKQAMRVATTTPVTVSATTDCIVATKLGAAGAVAVNLPAGANGQVFMIVDQTGDANTNNITITPNGAETINGSATYVINDNKGAVILAYSTTNTKWNIVGRYIAGSVLVNPMATTGDMVYGASAGVATNLATGATAGVLHGGNAAVPSWSTVVNADVSASAAIVGSKLAAATTSVTGTLSYYETTSFTTTFTGAVAGSPTSTSYCTRLGNACTVTFTGLGSTAAAAGNNVMSLGTLAAGRRPVVDTYFMIPAVVGSSAVAIAGEVSSAGVVTLYGSATVGAGWGASGNHTVYGFSVSFTVA